MDQVKFAAQLQNPNILKIFGIGKVDASYYISYEFLEGKSLRAIFSRCRQDGFPFSVDHALLIASKICSALEYAHARKNEAGGRYFHGLVTPASVLVSYEGEVRAARVRLLAEPAARGGRPARGRAAVPRPRAGGRRDRAIRSPTSSRWVRSSSRR